MFRAIGFGAILLTTATGLAMSERQPANRELSRVEWRFYSGDNGATKYSPLDQIDKSNVANLKLAWRRPQVDADLLAANPVRLLNNFRSTPIMVHGVLYASNGVGLAEAFDPGTGKTLWVQKPDGEGMRGSANRGVAYWGEGADARIITFRGRYLYALDPNTGEPIAAFGNGGVVDLGADVGPRSSGYRWNSVPLIARDVIVMGSAMVDQDSASKIEGDPGDVRAYDVRTGKLRWTFHVVPTADDKDAIKTWVGDSWQYTGAGNVWSLMSADDELGYVYLPTTSVTNDMYGGARLGDNLYSSSIVCVDAATGKRVWHYQTVHHDLFDYDNPAAPILVDISVDGKKIKALAQITKQSWAYVLDRVTGKPIWPIVEKPVEKGTVPGEWYSPTQPIPSKPAAYDTQGLVVDDLIDFTPELRAEAEKIASRYKLGPVFTPPVVSTLPGPLATLAVATAGGGTNWPGGSVDPETGILYVSSSKTLSVLGLVPPRDPTKNDLAYVQGNAETGARTTGGSGANAGPGGGGEGAGAPQAPTVRGLPLVKPPYGRLTAIDMKRGEILWQVAHGETPDNVRNNPALKGVTIPRTGRTGTVGQLVTKTLLIAGEAGFGPTPSGARGAMLRAYDKATGNEVGAVYMPAPQSGSPMTYMLNGEQYLVVAISGAQYPGELLALKLPRR